MWYATNSPNDDDDLCIQNASFLKKTHLTSFSSSLAKVDCGLSDDMKLSVFRRSLLKAQTLRSRR